MTCGKVGGAFAAIGHCAPGTSDNDRLRSQVMHINSLGSMSALSPLRAQQQPPCFLSRWSSLLAEVPAAQAVAAYAHERKYACTSCERQRANTWTRCGVRHSSAFHASQQQKPGTVRPWHATTPHPGAPAVARQVWRAQPAEREALIRMLRPPWDTLPPEFQAARAHHIGVNPQYPPLDLLGCMRAAADRSGGTPRGTNAVHVLCQALQRGHAPKRHAVSSCALSNAAEAGLRNQDWHCGYRCL